MGLGGLLIFTVISTIGSWRLFRLAAQASRESEAAAGAVQELARHLSVEAGSGAEQRRPDEPCRCLPWESFRICYGRPMLS